MPTSTILSTWCRPWYLAWLWTSPKTPSHTFCFCCRTAACTFPGWSCWVPPPWAKPLWPDDCAPTWELCTSPWRHSWTTHRLRAKRRAATRSSKRRCLAIFWAPFGSFQGWVLDGLPQTRLQARSLQQGGVIPKHVVLLVAGEDVLLERHRGRLLDPLTRDVYHETFARPREEAARRAEKSADAHVGALRAHLQRYRCKVTGLSSAYRHILTTVDADQPPLDVYQQALAFLRTRRCSRTPRVLLLGPPGSGKRLQAKMLAEKYKMVDVCCSDLLRWAEADPSSVGEEVRTYVQHNRTVPKSVTLKVFQERLDRADCSQRGWILHHLPCDLQHAKHLTESLNAPNRVFFLELTDDVCLQRTTITPVHPRSVATPNQMFSNQSHASMVRLKTEILLPSVKDKYTIANAAVWSCDVTFCSASTRHPATSANVLTTHVVSRKRSVCTGHTPQACSVCFQMACTWMQIRIPSVCLRL
ncbi:adenylate kinase 8-like isoform 6-T7 [Syngnathus typhle]